MQAAFVVAPQAGIKLSNNYNNSTARVKSLGLGVCAYSSCRSCTNCLHTHIMANHYLANMHTQAFSLLARPHDSRLLRHSHAYTNGTEVSLCKLEYAYKTELDLPGDSMKVRCHFASLLQGFYGRPDQRLRLGLSPLHHSSLRSGDQQQGREVAFS